MLTRCAAEKIGKKWSAGKQRAAKMVRFCFAGCELYVSRKQLNKSALNG